MATANHESQPTDPGLSADSSAQIVAILHRIALTSDLGSIAELERLFTEDVAIDLFGDITSGRQACIASIAGRRSAGRAGPSSGTRHLVTTVVVDWVEDASAASRATILLSRGSNPVELLRTVTYHDQWRRDAGGWRLARRAAAWG